MILNWCDAESRTVGLTKGTDELDAGTLSLVSCRNFSFTDALLKLNNEYAGKKKDNVCYTSLLITLQITSSLFRPVMAVQPVDTDAVHLLNHTLLI